MFDDLGGSWSISIIENAKFRKCTVKKVCSGRKPRVCLDTPLVKRFCVWLIDQPNHLSRSQKYRWVIQERSMESPLILWYGSLWYTQETHRAFRNVVPAETLLAWSEGNKDRMKWRKAVGFPQLTCRKCTNRTTQLQTWATIQGREIMTSGQRFRCRSKHRKRCHGPGGQSYGIKEQGWATED